MYAYFTNYDDSDNFHSRLYSPMIQPTKDMCLKFWMWLTNFGEVKLNVFLNQDGIMGNPLRSISYADSSYWEGVQVDVNSTDPFQVNFYPMSVSFSEYFNSA